MTTIPNQSVLALDVGTKRVGVAIASLAARLPRPLVTLEMNDGFVAHLQGLLEQEAVGQLVVGLPRGMQGQSTAQTAMVEDFVADLQKQIDLPVAFQDEAVTSAQAEAELQERGKPYAKGDIDALAATYILQDWLSEHAEAKNV